MKPACCSGARQRWFLVVLLVAASMPCDVGWVYAQAGRPLQPRHTRTDTLTLRHDVLTRLTAAQRVADTGGLDEAERLLAALERDYPASSGARALNGYELANVYNFRAWIRYTKKDFPAAIRAWEQVLAQPGLPEPMEESTRYSLAQLYLASSDWKRAAAMLDAWFRLADDPAPEAYILLAQARYQLGQHDAALQGIGRALAEARSRGQPPRENWYLLQRMASFAKGDLAATAATLEELAGRWPRKDYFVQLAGIFGELGEPVRRLAALETAYRSGWLTAERELLNLVYLYLDNGTPMRAAHVLERGMQQGQVEADARNLELLGAALREARENRRAVEVLTRAATLANDAQAWLRVASLELEENANEDAVAAAHRALDLGGGSRPDSVQIVLGMALYNLGRYVDARSAFNEAARDRRSRQSAEQWLRFLDTEITRADRLARDFDH